MSDPIRLRIEEAARSLSSFIADCPLISARRRPLLVSRMEEVKRAVEAADRPLRLALLGGTGVGKSTIINALAGREISPGSRRRPTTTRIVAYAHRGWMGEEDLPLDEMEQIRRHDEEGIRDLIIIDFPDFDSLREEGRQTVDRFLPRMDQILWVVDKEKYNDRRLHDGYLRKEAPYRQNFVFLFNKVDEFIGRAGLPDGERELEICISDLTETLEGEGIESPVLYRISAADALSRKGDGKGDPVGEFDEFEEQVRTRYTEKYRAEIRKGNIVKGLGTLASEVAEEVQAAEAEARIREAREGLDRIERSLLEAGERLVVNDVLSPDKRRSIAALFQREYLEDLPGMIGLLAEMRVFRLPAIIGGGGLPAAGRFTAEMRSLLEGAEEGGGIRRFYTLLVNAALDLKESVETFAGPKFSAEEVRVSEDAFQGRLREALREMEVAAHRSIQDAPFAGKGKILQHLLPWGIAAVLGAAAFELRKELAQTGTLPTFLFVIPIALLTAYLGEAALAHRAVKREARRRVEGLAAIVRGSYREIVIEDLVRKGRELLIESERIFSRWREVEQAIAEATGPVDDLERGDR